MTEAVDLGYAIKQTPRAAVAYFKSKGYTISWDWWETWQGANTKAFTVAKATRLDVLQSVRGSLQEVIDNGYTERKWAKNIQPELKRLGWWGRQVVVDSDGNAEIVQLGSPHRLKTIYRTNMATTYAAARHQAHLANAESRPYWMYMSRRDQLVRSTHAALDGKVFRYDDAFWQTHYPPNDFNCRCHVRALTSAQIKERGLVVEDTQGKLSEITQVAGIDKKTGEVITRPGTAFRTTDQRGRKVTMTPGAGWSYNPGKDVSLFDRNGNVPDDVLGLVKNQKTFRDFGLPKLMDTPQSLRDPIPGLLSKANSVDAALLQLTAALAIPNKGWRKVETPTGLDDVVISKSYLPHIVEKRDAAREQFANYILPTLMDPLEVWLTQYEDGSFRRRFVKVFDASDAKQSLVIARENKDGSLMFNFVPVNVPRSQRYLDAQRSGFLLHRKKER